MNKSIKLKIGMSVLAMVGTTLHANDGGILVYQTKEITVEKKAGKPTTEDASKVYYAKAKSDDAKDAIATFYRVAGKPVDKNTKILLVEFQTRTATTAVETLAKIDLRTPDATPQDETKVVKLVFDKISCAGTSNATRINGTCEMSGPDAARIFKVLPEQMSAVSGAPKHQHGLAAIAGFKDVMLEGAVTPAAKKTFVFGCQDADALTAQDGGPTTWVVRTPDCTVTYDSYTTPTGWFPLEYFGDWSFWKPTHAVN